MANEIKQLFWGSQASPVASSDIEAGDFTLSFGGDTTGTLNYNDSAATIQTALEGLASIGSGNIAVTSQSNGFTFEFQGSLANTNTGNITLTEGTAIKQRADSLSVSTTTEGAVALEEIHEFALNGATTGTFDISWDGGSTLQTVDLSSSPDSSVQSAYDSHYGSGVFTFFGFGAGYGNAVSATGGTYSGSAPSIYNDTTDGSGVSVSNLQYGQDGAYQVVAVVLPNGPTEGTLNVTLGGSSTAGNYDCTSFSPGAITGWTGGGSAGNWTYTSDTAAASVSVSGAEGTTPLRKAVATEFITVQEGGSVASAVPFRRRTRRFLQRF